MKNIAGPILLSTALLVGAARASFAPLDDSLFGSEIRSTLHLGLGLGYAKVAHPWYDLYPYDQAFLRLRLLSDAGNFYTALRGVYGECEVSYATAQYLQKSWSFQAIDFLNLNLGFSFRDRKDNTVFFPYFQVGAGFTGVASRSQGAAGYTYEPAVHYGAKVGFEWLLLGGWLALCPGLSVTAKPYAQGLMLDPVVLVGFHVDLMGYFL